MPDLALKNCPRCGYQVEDPYAARCPRCSKSLFMPSCCRGNCSSCGKNVKSTPGKCKDKCTTG